MDHSFEQPVPSAGEAEPYHGLPAEIPLPEAVATLDRLFSRAGKALFVVGGAVRDYLFHKFHDPEVEYHPKDVDLATEAQPEEVLAILQAAEARREKVFSFPKGEAFGVISAVVRGQEFEIATFREEWYDPEAGDGRRPDRVRFSTPGRDAQRRDLTINALFYDIHQHEIRDYNLGPNGKGLGIEDIRRREVRPVGDPRERFREDKLRIPRLVRFFSQYNPGEIASHLSQATLDAVAEFRHLRGVSPERIVAEFLIGLHRAIDPVRYLKNHAALDLYPAIFPGTKVDVEDLDRIGGTRNPKAVLAWMLKSHGPPRAVKNMLRERKYPGEIFERVEFLLYLYRLQPEHVFRCLRLRDLYKQEKDPQASSAKKQEMEQDVADFAHIAGLEKELTHFLAYQPVARAEDFTHLAGPAISQAMAALEAEAYRTSLAGK